MKQSSSKSELYARSNQQTRAKEFGTPESRMIVKKKREEMFKDVLKLNREKTQPNENNGKPTLPFTFFANINQQADEYLLRPKLQKLAEKVKPSQQQPRPKSSSNAKLSSPKTQKILYCDPRKPEHKKKHQLDTTKDQLKPKPTISIKQTINGAKKSGANYAERSSQTSGGLNPPEHNTKKTKKKKGTKGSAEQRNSLSRSIDAKSKDINGDHEASEYFLERISKQASGILGFTNQKLRGKREEDTAETAAKKIQHGFRNWARSKSPKLQMNQKTGRIHSERSLESSKKEIPDKSIASDSDHKSTPQKTYIIKQNSSNGATPIGKDSSDTFSAHFNKKKETPNDLNNHSLTSNKETSLKSIRLLCPNPSLPINQALLKKSQKRESSKPKKELFSERQKSSKRIQ